jgi:iron complex outermembrane recepter protein
METYVDFNFQDRMIYEGSKDLDLMTMDLLEMGYRGKLKEGLQIDGELFYSKAKNFANATVLENVSETGVLYFKAKNLSVKPEQMGATIGLNYFPNSQLQLRPFITFQKTDLKELDTNLADMQDITTDEEHKWTPDYYGGIYINYMPIQKLNINLNSYFYGEQTFEYLNILTEENPAEPTRLITEVPANFILNAKISYNFWENSSIYFNGRNLLGSGERQFAWTNEIESLYLAGIMIDF